MVAEAEDFLQQPAQQYSHEGAPHYDQTVSEYEQDHVDHHVRLLTHPVHDAET